MDEIAEIAPSIVVGPPPDGFCSVCLTGAVEGLTFVNSQASFDGMIINKDGAVLASLDSISLCENCVRGFAEALAFKPERYNAALREVRAGHKREDKLTEQNQLLRSALAVKT
jgi:hypothetical protein